MAGFRQFVTGEVLTASNVDDFLAKQSVMKFADAAARNTALGTATGGSNALREGMVAYLDDTDELQKYDGAAWGSVGGGLVAVKHVLFTGTQTNSTAAGANFAVTDLSITHETADVANKLIISAFLGAAATNRPNGNVGIAVHDGTVLIAIGAAEGTRTRVSAGGFSGTDLATITTSSPSVTFVHTPGAGSKTYTVRAICIDIVTRTVYINRSQGDDDNATSTRTVSSLVIQEVSV